MKASDYTKPVLLDVLGSYLRMIERSGDEYPTVVLNDIRSSIKFVLKTNNYDGKYADSVYESEV